MALIDVLNVGMSLYHTWDQVYGGDMPDTEWVTVIYREETGRAFMREGRWCVELAGGEQLWLVPGLLSDKDQNRFIIVGVPEDPKDRTAKFLGFVSDCPMGHTYDCDCGKTQ